MLPATDDPMLRTAKRTSTRRSPATCVWLAVALTSVASGSAAGPPAALAETEADETILVSRASGAAGVKSNDHSGVPSASADGGSIAFRSAASNLHPDDTDSIHDVFVRSPRTHQTTLVSRASGAAGAKGNGASGAPAMSGDGRHVAFDSFSTNLHPDDTDTLQDVLLRDRDGHQTLLVSRASGAAGAKGNGFSTDPSVSADGRFVAFHSTATNLHPDDTDDVFDVFVRDLDTHQTILVSRASGAAGAAGSGPSSFASISADGRFVAFHSTATNLHPDDTDTVDDVYVRDLDTHQTILVSRASGAAGDKGDFPSRDPAMSSDGRFVAFDSFATNLHPADADNNLDIYVRDLDTHATNLVSRVGTLGGSGNNHSVSPSISRHGRYVAFHTLATNLHPDDPDAVLDVLVRDLQTSGTTLVSRASGPSGTKGNADSFDVALSADGRFAAFETQASNLHPDDPDATPDVLARDVLGPIFADGFESGGTGTWSSAVE